MRLENLYENFGLASPSMQAQYIINYRLRRAEDMEKPSNWPKEKKTSSPKQAASPITDEEAALMKLLGLKKKDVLALRAISELEE